MATDYDAPRKTDDDDRRGLHRGAEVPPRRQDRLQRRRRRGRAGRGLRAARRRPLRRGAVGAGPAPSGRRVHLLALLPRPPPQPAREGGRRPAGLPRVRGLSPGPDTRGRRHRDRRRTACRCSCTGSTRTCRSPATPTRATPGPTSMPGSTSPWRPGRAPWCRPASRSRCPSGLRRVRAPAVGAGRPPRRDHRSTPRGRSTPATAARSTSTWSTSTRTEPFTVRRGDRIAQLVIQEVSRADVPRGGLAPGQPSGGHWTRSQRGVRHPRPAR